MSATADRVAAWGLDRIRAGVRRIPPDRRAQLTRRCKPGFERLLRRVGDPGRRADEKSLRAAVDADPTDGEGCYQLGLSLAGHRPRQAAEAFVTAAERGVPLNRVTMHLLNEPAVRRHAGSDSLVDRMRALARPGDGALRQLHVGAFLLDQDRLDEGRTLLRRGYVLELAEARSAATAEVHRPPGRQGPDFLILGPSKTGSTSLYAFVTEHPLVVATPRKELQFWKHRYGRSTDVYAAYFPDRLPAGFITGEASVTLLAQPEVVHDLAARSPDLRVVVLHREPVARVYSEHQMARRERWEPRTFDATIEYELRRLGDVAPVEPDRLVDHRDLYLLRGCILPYLRLWVEALGPDRVMVVESAALAERRQETVDAVHLFLGVEPVAPVRGDDQNVHVYEPMPDALAARLTAWYAPHERALGEYLADLPNVIALHDD